MFRFANLWSSQFTWGISGKMPAAGNTVIVPEGQSVVLDMDTPILKMLHVNGMFKSLQRILNQNK